MNPAQNSSDMLLLQYMDNLIRRMELILQQIEERSDSLSEPNQ